LRRVDSTYNYYIGEKAASWGNGHPRHSGAFNEDYNSIELSWLLDGSLFPVGREIMKSDCQKIVEGNFSAASAVLMRASQNLHVPPPDKADVYTLVIKKFHLSYAVRNDVDWQAAERAFKVAMGW